MTFPLGYQNLVSWWTKGVLIQNLTGEDGRTPKSVEKAINALVIGLLVGVAIELSVLVTLFPKLLSAPLVAFWLFLLIHVVNVLCFVILLHLSLLAFRANPKLFAVPSLTFYAFSGAIPLLMLLTVEQLGEAIQLFVLYHDPGRPYMSAATFRLLFPEQATAFAIARAWVLFLLEVVVFILYFPIHLRRVLIESSSARHASLKVTAALLLAVIVDALFVRYYFGRAYWLLIRSVIRA